MSEDRATYDGKPATHGKMLNVHAPEDASLLRHLIATICRHAGLECRDSTGPVGQEALRIALGEWVDGIRDTPEGNWAKGETEKFLRINQIAPSLDDFLKWYDKLPNTF